MPAPTQHESNMHVPQKKFFYTGLTELLQGLHIEVQTADATIMECMKKLFANLGTLDSNDNDNIL